MANFAELDENNKVVRVVVIDDKDCLDENGQESESIGIAFCQKLFNGGKWLQTSYTRSFRINFAGPGMYYFPELDAFLMPKPHPWYYLNENNEWVRPLEINDNTGQPFTHEELTYLAYYIRNTKSYRFCPAVLKNTSEEFLYKACTSTDFMYPTFEGLVHGSDRTKEIAKIQVKGDEIYIPFVYSLIKEVDLTPLGIVLEVKWEELNPDIAADSLNSHPQTAARTRQELFRLIIEWAYAHTHFGNNELAAVTCHRVLCQVQMPLEVRNELLTMIEPQAVECYITGDFPFRNTSFETLQDPISPPLFTEWYNSLMITYPGLKKNEPLTVNGEEIPNSYPV